MPKTVMMPKTVDELSQSSNPNYHEGSSSLLSNLHGLHMKISVFQSYVLYRPCLFVLHCSVVTQLIFSILHSGKLRKSQ